MHTTLEKKMSVNRSIAAVAMLLLGGCASTEDFRKLESYVADSNAESRMTPEEAVRALQSFSNAAVSVEYTAASLDFINNGRICFRSRTPFTIPIREIDVVSGSQGDNLRLFRKNDGDSYELDLNDIDGKIYVACDGWGHALPFIGLKRAIMLGGFADYSGGSEEVKRQVLKIADALQVLKKGAVLATAKKAQAARAAEQAAREASAAAREVAAEAAVRKEQREFDAAARGYRAAASKPALPEEARRYKVQAEEAINEKDFESAAGLFHKALAVAPWWPEGRFNLALVLSETGGHKEAIVEMKRYLALVPNAPDAREAQDKIYAWERKAQ